MMFFPGEVEWTIIIKTGITFTTDLSVLCAYQMQMQAGLPMQMQGNYLKEMEYEKDLDRMRELYPNEVKRSRNMWTKNVTEWSMREA